MSGENKTYYYHRGFFIRPDMVGALELYVNKGIDPGSFLTAVIQNKGLFEVCDLADDINIRNLPAFVGYLWNEAPSTCWGSKEKMDAWKKRLKQKRGD